MGRIAHALAATCLALPALCIGCSPPTSTPSSSAEPEYDGKSLSQWTEVLKDGDSDERNKAVAAFAHFGPEAAPMMDTIVSEFKTAYIVDNHVAVVPAGYWDSRTSMVEALGKIGPGAIPALTKLWREDKAPSAPATLARMGDEGIKVITDVIEDRDAPPRMRSSALSMVNSVARENMPGKIRVTKSDFGDDGKLTARLVPVIIKALDDPDIGMVSEAVSGLRNLASDEVQLALPHGEYTKNAVGSLVKVLAKESGSESFARTRADAALTLGYIGLESSTVVPALRAQLADKAVQRAAALALGRFGAEAKDAFADVLQIYQAREAHTDQASSEETKVYAGVLWQIDPARAKKEDVMKEPAPPYQD